MAGGHYSELLSLDAIEADYKTPARDILDAIEARKLQCAKNGDGAIFLKRRHVETWLARKALRKRKPDRIGRNDNTPEKADMTNCGKQGFRNSWDKIAIFVPAAHLDKQRQDRARAKAEGAAPLPKSKLKKTA